MRRTVAYSTSSTTKCLCNDPGREFKRGIPVLSEGEYADIEYAALPVNSCIFPNLLCCTIIRYNASCYPLCAIQSGYRATVFIAAYIIDISSG
jgi:hypothetical protein